MLRLRKENQNNGSFTIVGERYHAMLAIGLLSIFFLGLPDLYGVREESIQPKLWFFASLALALPYLATDRRGFGSFLVSPFSVFIYLFVLLNLIHLPFTDSANQWETVITRLEYLLFSLPITYVLVSAFRRFRLGGVFYGLILISAALVAYSFAVPGELYPLDTTTWGRGGGALVNPNNAGEALVLLFIFAAIPSKGLHKHLIALMAGLGALLTVSRAAIIAWLVCAVWLYARQRLSLQLILSSILVLGVVIYSGYSMVRLMPQLPEFEQAADNIRDRFNFFSSGHMDDESAQDRKLVALGAIAAISDSPLVGIGAGATASPGVQWPFDIGAHNQWLLLGVEYGIVGMIIWAWFIWQVWWRQRSLAFIPIIILFFSVFNHNMFDHLYWLISLGIFASIPLKQCLEQENHVVA